MAIRRFQRFTLIVMLSAIAHQSYPQNSNSYTVLKATGAIYCSRLKKNLQNSDKITDHDKLTFTAATDYLIVINPKEGRKIVRDTGPLAGSELNSLLTDIVSLEKRRTSSRGNSQGSREATALRTLRSQFDVDSLLILGSGKVSLDGAGLLLNDTATIKVRYKYNVSMVEKQTSTGSILDLSQKFIFEDHAVREVQLIYYRNAQKDIFKNPPEVLGTFYPIYAANPDGIKKEAQTVITTFAEMNQEGLIKEVERYFEDEYGPILTSNLVSWLHETNLLKP
jgi:hypothetical protein